jgi:hypothetical protein
MMQAATAARMTALPPPSAPYPLPSCQAHRHRQELRATLLAWCEYVQHKRRKRQLLLRAEACYVFMTLLRVLQQWRAHTTDKQLARLRTAR